MLAGIDRIKYRQNELQFMPGDQIFLYADGVTEATDKDNCLYGEECLLESVNRNIIKNPGELLEAVKADVNAFVGEAPQFDDISIPGIELRYIMSDDAITVIADEKSMIPVESLRRYLRKNLQLYRKLPIM